jgi:hypothetical protein
MMLPPRFTMGMVLFPTDVMLGIQAKEFNLGFIRPLNLVSHGLRVLYVLLSKLQAGCHVPFTEEWPALGSLGGYKLLPF